jgi:ABC-type multidrug transport system fused ATPase/permease subunit
MIDQGILKQVVDQGSSYLFSMRWLLRNGLLSNAYRFWWLVILSLVSIVAQAATVSSIFIYVRLLEKKIELPGGLIQEDWVRSQYGLISFVLVFCILLGLNYLAVYLIRIQAINLMREVEARFGRLALKYAAKLPNLFCKATSKRASNQELIKLMSRDTRYCGMTIRLMVLMVPAAVTLSGAFLAILYQDWVLSSFVIVASLIIFLLQYPVNLKGARATRRWHSSRPLALKVMSAAIRELRLGNSSKSAVNQEGTTDIYQNPSVIKSIDTYADRIKAIETGAIATQVGTTFIIALIILIIGNRALSGTVDWAFMISYITLLRLASGHFTSVARYTTSMARLYPQVLDFVNFISDVDRIDRRAGGSNLPWQYEVSLSDVNESTQEDQNYLIESSDLAALVALGSKKTAQPEFAIALSGEVRKSTFDCVGLSTSNSVEQATYLIPVESLTGSVVRVAQNRLFSPLALADLLGVAPGPGNSSWSEAMDSLESIQPWLSSADLTKLRGLNLNQSGSSLGIDARTEIIAQLNAAVARQATIIIIEYDALRLLDVQEGGHPLLRFLQSRSLVFIWYTRDCLESNPSVVDYGEQNLVLCQENEICDSLFIGDQVGRDRLLQFLSGYDQKVAKNNIPSSVDSADDLLVELE